MSRLPNMPPPPAGEAVPDKPNAAETGVHTISDGPAPPPPPPSSQEPPQLPFLHSQAEPQSQEKGVFVSDDQFMHEFLKESHSTPLAVLIIGSVLAFLVFGYQGFVAAEPGMGIAAVVGTCFGVAVALGLGCLTSTATGWIICKIFGEDYGSALGLILRFSAVAAAQLPAFAVINYVVGGLLSLLFIVPVVMVLAMVIAGFDVIRAFLYCVILGVLNWMLFIFVAASFATAVMG